MAWFRTCQECGHVQTAISPEQQKGDGWTELKCRKCKSVAMDYGRERDPRLPREDFTK